MLLQRRRHQPQYLEPTSHASAPLGLRPSQISAREQLTVIFNIMTSIIAVVALALGIGLGIWTYIRANNLNSGCVTDCTVTPMIPLTEFQQNLEDCDAAFCNETCRNATDCANIDFKDVRTIDGFESLVLTVEKACVGGGCQFYFRVNAANDTFASAFRFSMRQTTFYNSTYSDYYDTYANTSFLGDVDYNRYGIYYSGAGYTDPYDPENLFCRYFLQPNQSYYSPECIIPFMFFTAQTGGPGEIELICMYYPFCKPHTLPIFVNESISY